MPVTYKKIASVTVGSGGAAEMNFTSIPGTYTDLVLKVSARDDDNTPSSFDFVRIQFNGSTSSLSCRFLRGNGTNAASGSSASVINAGISNNSTQTASTFSNFEVYIPNYAGSNNKSVSSDSVAENNATDNYMHINAGLWSDTSAITSIKLVSQAGSFVQHSTATLYGISKS